MELLVKKLIKIATDHENTSVEYIAKNIKTLSISFNQDDHIKVLRNAEELIKDCSLEEVALVLKGVIIGEVYSIGGYPSGYGSVTASVPIALHLESVNTLVSQKIFIWANNFGFDNSFFTSASYIEEFSESFQSRQYHLNTVNNTTNEKEWIDSSYKLYGIGSYENFTPNYVRDAQRKNRRQYREEQNLEMINNNIEDVRSGKQKELNSILEKSTIIEKLHILSMDSRHTCNYYPARLYDDVSLNDIRSLDDESIYNLAVMFELPIREYSEWFLFYKKVAVLGIIGKQLQVFSEQSLKLNM